MRNGVPLEDGNIVLDLQDKLAVRIDHDCDAVSVSVTVSDDGENLADLATSWSGSNNPHILPVFLLLFQ